MDPSHRSCCQLWTRGQAYDSQFFFVKDERKLRRNSSWVVSAHLKNMSQIGSSPQVGMNIKRYLKPPPRISTWTFQSFFVPNDSFTSKKNTISVSCFWHLFGKVVGRELLKTTPVIYLSWCRCHNEINEPCHRDEWWWTLEWPKSNTWQHYCTLLVSIHAIDSLTKRDSMRMCFPFCSSQLLGRNALMCGTTGRGKGDLVTNGTTHPKISTWTFNHGDWM